MEDGKNCINIYSKGKTPLGKWLSNLSTTKVFNYDGHWLETVESYWYWKKLATKVSAQDRQSLEKMFNLNGFEVKKLGQSIQKKYDWSDNDEGYMNKEFKDSILGCIKTKIDFNSEMKQQFILSTLPFAHYYEYGDKQTLLPQYDWIIEWLEEYRYALQVKYLEMLLVKYGNRVHNMNNTRNDNSIINIGRPSIYGNPFTMIDKNDIKERVKVVIQYRQELPNTNLTVKSLLLLKDKHVKCYCNDGTTVINHNHFCHGLPLLSYVDAISNQYEEEQKCAEVRKQSIYESNKRSSAKKRSFTS